MRRASGVRSGLSKSSLPLAPVLSNRPSGPGVHPHPPVATHLIGNLACQVSPTSGANSLLMMIALP